MLLSSTTERRAPHLGMDDSGPRASALNPEIAATRHLSRPGGRIAYSLVGQGPLFICIPGMGDVRSVYASLASALAKAGFRVATMDLRGHGASDVTFEAYDDAAAGSDIVALAELLEGPAILVGNSMGAGASCWAAAEAPAMTAGLVLLGPFVRDGRASGFSKLLFRMALLRPWGPAVWRSYYKKLYPTRRVGGYDAHFTEAMGSLRKPGHWEAFRKTARTSHASVEARLGEVHAPALVVMGSLDPDFSDPRAEAQWIAGQLQAKVLMVPGAGHYPQAEFPELVSPAVVAFARDLKPTFALGNASTVHEVGRSPPVIHPLSTKEAT